MDLISQIDAAVDRTGGDLEQQEIANFGLRRLDELTTDDEW